jgi:hypothetical protein
VAVPPLAFHNDVFFRRRNEDPQPVSASIPKQATKETPEIAEVNDIVRIAEAAQASKPTVVESLPPAVDEPVGIVQTPPPLAPQTGASTETQPEPRKGEGFFRRLFGRHTK